MSSWSVLSEDEKFTRFPWDREQAPAIEAGDSIELLRRALPPEALPVLLTTVRQATRRGRAIAALFREGNARDALEMKREDGHARLLGGDRDQVVGQIADLYIERRDILLASGSKRGITISAPTNEDAADISQAIRARLKERREIAAAEAVHRAIDQNGPEYDLALATGDRVRLFRRTWGSVGDKEHQVGNNGDVVEILSQSDRGLRVRTAKGEIADIDWYRLADKETGRLLLGLGHALTIDAAQGLTSDEHINALPRGTSGVTGFTSYVAESRDAFALIEAGSLDAGGQACLTPSLILGVAEEAAETPRQGAKGAARPAHVMSLADELVDVRKTDVA